MEEWIILLFPLAMFGLWHIMIWIKEKYLVKKGYFRVIFRLPNHRKLVKILKPEKTYLKYKDNIYPFSDKAGFIYYGSSVPEIEFDLHGDQINFQRHDLTANLDPKSLSALAMRMFNLGKKQGRKKENYAVVFSMVAAGASVLTLLLLWGLSEGMAV